MVLRNVVISIRKRGNVRGPFFLSTCDNIFLTTYSSYRCAHWVTAQFSSYMSVIAKLQSDGCCHQTLCTKCNMCSARKHLRTAEIHPRISEMDRDIFLVVSLYSLDKYIQQQYSLCQYKHIFLYKPGSIFPLFHFSVHVSIKN